MDGSRPNLPAGCGLLHDLADIGAAGQYHGMSGCNQQKQAGDGRLGARLIDQGVEREVKRAGWFGSPDAGDRRPQRVATAYRALIAIHHSIVSEKRDIAVGIPCGGTGIGARRELKDRQAIGWREAHAARRMERAMRSTSRSPRIALGIMAWIALGGIAL